MARCHIQRNIFYNKKKLKSKKNSTNESLTKTRMVVLKKSIGRVGILQCLVV